MTFGVSNLPGANGALAGAGLSGDGAMAAQNFLNALLGQGDAPKSGGQAFLADVKDAKNPEEKRALIDGFAEGFAAASGGAEGGEGAGGAENASGGQGAQGASGSEGAQGADGAGEGEEAASPQELMKGFQEIADRVADSDLPKKAKNKLLDGIAELMSKLKAESPSEGDLESAAGPSAGANGGGAEGAGSPAAAPNGGQAEGAGGSQGAQGANGGQAERPGGSQSANGTDGSDSSSGENNGVWSHEVKDGEATIRLGDNYTIKANEKDATWTVTNNETGKSTTVSGDPHVDANSDGKNDFDFKKDMTFKLDDGTKITVGTVPGGENGTTFSSQLTITNGDNAVQVSGLGDKHDGEGNLEVKQSMEGEVVDNLENDGSSTIYENGGAWSTGGKNPVDQAYIDRAEAMAS